MKLFLTIIILFFLSTLPAHAGCKKSEICSMLGKMDHFSILNKCPNSGPLLAECKKVKETTIEDLLPAEFIDNGDGTVTDTVNNLLWMKKGELDEKGNLTKVKLKIAKKIAAASSHAGRTNWRIPSLVEMPADGPCVFTGKAAIYYGDSDYFDDGVGHTLLKNQPLAICDKTAGQLEDWLKNGKHGEMTYMENLAP